MGESTKSAWPPDDDNDEYLSDDDSAEDSIEDHNHGNSSQTEQLLVEEINYESTICDQLHNYGVEETIFTDGELEETK